METVTRRRVAIGGTFACDEALAVPLQYLLTNAVWKIAADVQWLRYGSLMNFDEWSTEVLHAAHPADLVVMLVRLSDLEAAHPELSMSAEGDESAGASEQKTDFMNSPIEQFLRDLERYDAIATTSSTAPLMVLLCPCAPTATAKFESRECEMQKRIGAMKNVHVQSSKQLMELFRQQYTSAFYDAINDKRQHSPYTQAMLNVLGLTVTRQICRLFRTANSQKKVIVLDCDNTLWGGAVAEVGAHGIDLAPRFIALQRFVIAHQQRGMLLSLCSKNIHDDVAQAFKQRRRDMVLSLEKHIVANKINWRRKSDNIVELARELSLGLDSFVFIDDNPLECNEVASALPSVTVINLGSDFSASFLDHEWVFDEGFNVQSRSSAANTTEDSQRTKLYRENRQRQQFRETSSTHKAFLSALGVKIVFEELNPANELVGNCSSFTRALQLHHRTNQFNTSTTFAKRLEEKELRKYVTAPAHTAICAHVTDRFGHYGLVSAALCQHRPCSDILQVDSFLLSCRALNRGVEHAMLRKLGEIASKAGAETLKISWEPTERNQPAHAFFSQLSDVSFAARTEQEDKILGKEKQRHSASKAGSWIITAKKATDVAFLKSEVSAHHSNSNAQGLVRWLLHSLSVQWLRNTVFSAITWMLSSFTPQWITQLIRPLFLRGLHENGPTGLLRVSFYDRGSLDQFVRPILNEVSSVNGFAPAVTDSADSNEDDKFRRKARHQTKLVLTNHLHEETSQVIWSANRPYTDAKQIPGAHDGEEANNAEPIERFRLVCQSPQCAAVIQRDIRCAFERCRNCCYRIQRLLTRSLHHANVDARQSAEVELQKKFAIDANQVASKEEQCRDRDTKWCEAHQNKRRRGEICRVTP